MWNIRLICDPIALSSVNCTFRRSTYNGKYTLLGHEQPWKCMFQWWVGIKNCVKPPPNWLPGQFLRFIDHKLVGFSKTNSNNCSQNLLFLCLFSYEKLSVVSGFWNGNWNKWFFNSDFFLIKNPEPAVLRFFKYCTPW
jgi:hypothetical protein